MQTLTVIRETSQGTNFGTVRTQDILSPIEFRDFWASAAGGVIRIGQGTHIGAHLLTEWVDNSEVLDVRYVAVSTGWGSQGQWSLCVGNSSASSSLSGQGTLTAFYHLAGNAIDDAGTRHGSIEVRP